MNLSVQIVTSSESLGLGVDIGLRIIGPYCDNIEALKAAELNKPSIILLDYEVVKNNTALYIKTLLIESPDSKVILLGKGLTDELILSCLINGCYGYLDFVDIEQYLIKAIRAVGDGEAWFSRKLVGLLIGMIRD